MRMPPLTSCVSIALLVSQLTGCSALLPKGETLTQGPWQSFWDAQRTFDHIIPHQTTLADLQQLGLDPKANPNMTILNYSDVLRRFVPSPSINAQELDAGVQECIAAKMECKGYEIDLHVIKRTRYGGFWSDFLNFRRNVDVTGWRFNGVILIRDNLVVYKLTGGQPAIREHEENRNPLGPLQGIGESQLPRP